MTKIERQITTKQGRALLEHLEREYPHLYAFVQPMKHYGNSRRLGPVRQAYLYRIFSACPSVTEDTTPHDLGKNPEMFWDLADAAASLGDDKAYALDTVRILYTHLETSRKLSSRFFEGKRSPRYVIQNEEFRRHLTLHYNGREEIYILRHGQMKHSSNFLVLPYKNPYLREALTDCIIDWPEAWMKRTPSRLNVLPDAEEWFEGTTNGITSWEGFNAKTLDTARRHILSKYEDPEWRRICMKFLFFFYSQLILTHKEHDFFADSYIYNTLMVINKDTPNHLAAGYEFAVYGQKDTFRQGKGVLFVIYDADLHESSNRKTEIKRFDLSKITVPQYWDAVANYILHNKRDNVIAARSFLLWLQDRKRLAGDKTYIITGEDIDEYRIHVSKTLDNSGSRNAYLTCVNRFMKWLQGTDHVLVAPDAQTNMDMFFSNYKKNANPLSKEAFAVLTDTLKEMGKTNPRYLLTLIITHLIPLMEMRPGSIVTIEKDNITLFEDGTVKVTAVSKTTNPSKTTFYEPKLVADLLVKAMELTEEIREECPKCDLRKQLFLYHAITSNNGMPFNAFTIQRYNLDLKEACRKAGLPLYNSGNLRDSFMTLADIYIHTRKLSEYERALLTHHADKRSIRNYAVITIGDILERTPEIHIGKLPENKNNR